MLDWKRASYRYTRTVHSNQAYHTRSVQPVINGVVYSRTLTKYVCFSDDACVHVRKHTHACRKYKGSAAFIHFGLKYSLACALFVPTRDTAVVLDIGATALRGTW